MIGKVIQNKICIKVNSIKDINRAIENLKQNGHSSHFISNIKVECFDSQTYLTISV